ncbi:SPFH domain-containing protein [archaeon]
MAERKQESVIQWKEQDEGEIVYRYPDQEFLWMSQLTIREDQVAVFYKDGKVLDVLEAGRHSMNTKNLPLLYNIIKKIGIFDEASPFKSELFFVSVKKFQGNFGLTAQTKDLAPLQVHGNFWFTVGDAKKFVLDVVGGQNAYTTEGVNEFIKGYVNEHIMKEISKEGLDTVFTKLGELSSKSEKGLAKDMKNIGLSLINLRFVGVDTTPEYRERLFYLMKGMDVTQYKAFETMEKVGTAPGTGGGGTIGMGMGLGMGMSAAKMLQGTMEQKVACPHCNTPNPPGAKFCSGCGKKMKK